MHDENKVFGIFSRRSLAITVLVALIIAILLFIAGSVMLGIGIHKFNTKAKSCDNDSNKGGQTITAKPFYLSVTNDKITEKQLNSDPKKAFADFKSAIEKQLPNSPEVTILTVAPSKTTSSSLFFKFAANGNNPVTALVSVIYTSDKAPTKDEITNKMKENGSKMSVKKIQDGTEEPTNKNDLYCNQVNTDCTSPSTPQNPLDCDKDKYNEKCLPITCGKNEEEKKTDQCKTYCAGSGKETLVCKECPAPQNIDCTKDNDKYNEKCLPTTCAKNEEKSVQQCKDYCNGSGKGTDVCKDSQNPSGIDCNDRSNQFKKECVSTTCVKDEYKNAVPCSNRIPQKIPTKGIYGKQEITFEMYVGTLGQKLEVKIPNQITKESGLFVTRDAFNSEKSTSFKPISHSLDDVQTTTGTDSFVITDAFFQEKMLSVRDKHDNKGNNQKYGLLYLNHGKTPVSNCGGGQSCPFIESILKDMPNKNVIFHFNQFTQGGNFNGDLILGKKSDDPIITTKPWTLLDEQPVATSNGNWYFKINNVMVGIGTTPFAADKIAIIDFGTSTYFQFPKSTLDYENIMKELKADEKGLVPCSPTTELVYTLGGKPLKISSDLYVVKNPKDPSGKCQVLLGKAKDDILRIPFVAFGGKFLMFDYENRKIGFVDV